MSTVNKRLAIVLMASVALNLFVAGFVVSQVVSGHHGSRGRHHRGPPPHGPFFGPRGLLSQAPDAEPAVREVMREHGERMRQEVRTLREKRRAVGAALRAEPFDREVLESALAELRAATASSQARMHAAMVELAARLPAEQRRKLAQHGRDRGL